MKCPSPIPDMRHKRKHNFYRLLPQWFEETQSLLFRFAGLGSQRIKVSGHSLSDAPNDSWSNELRGVQAY